MLGAEMSKVDPVNIDVHLQLISAVIQRFVKVRIEPTMSKVDPVKGCIPLQWTSAVFQRSFSDKDDAMRSKVEPFPYRYRAAVRYCAHPVSAFVLTFRSPTQFRHLHDAWMSLRD